MRSDLAAPLRDSEILLAPKYFKPLKAPGPGELHPFFFQNSWAETGLKTTTFCNKVFSSSTMPPKYNAIFLCLIPKCRNNGSLKKFRPIGLCHTSYKPVTKIIVNKIKPYLPTIIGPSEASFLANRRAFDHAIIIQEYITHFGKIKGKFSDIILKIDLEKAFGKIEWSFINETLQFFGFPTLLSSSCFVLLPFLLLP